MTTTRVMISFQTETYISCCCLPVSRATLESGESRISWGNRTIFWSFTSGVDSLRDWSCSHRNTDEYVFRCFGQKRNRILEVIAILTIGRIKMSNTRFKICPVSHILASCNSICIPYKTESPSAVKVARYATKYTKGRRNQEFGQKLENSYFEIESGAVRSKNHIRINVGIATNRPWVTDI